MTAKVLNKHRDIIPSGAVYIGRGSPYGNPFKIGIDGDRDIVCDRFEEEILPFLNVEPLRNKDLVCFCAPKRCHGHSIMNKLYNGGNKNLKLSEKTLNILKNFSLINESILINPGNKIEVIANTSEILAKATVEESFPEKIAIADLPELLGLISLMNDPTIEFDKSSLKLQDNSITIQYNYCNPQLISDDDHELTLPEPVAQFELKSESLQKILKVSGSMDLPHFNVVGEKGGNLKVIVRDNENDMSNKATISSVGSYEGNPFTAQFNKDFLKLYSGSYDVSLMDGLAKFSNKETDLVYFIAMNDFKE